LASFVFWSTLEQSCWIFGVNQKKTKDKIHKAIEKLKVNLQRNIDIEHRQFNIKRHNQKKFKKKLKKKRIFSIPFKKKKKINLKKNIKKKKKKFKKKKKKKKKFKKK